MYQNPPHIPPGEVIQGNSKWKIGPSLCVGGFGEIYSACEYRKDASTRSDVSGYPYVVKIEPIENGPLFVEMHFYNRNSNRDDIQRFMESRNLSKLGMPTYYGSGSHMFQNKELRFLILERYGTDLWTKFKEVGRKFPAPTVFQLGLQMLDVLDYIHSRSYIHANIKGANILMGIKEGTENQAYLLDFGLAYRIVGDNYKPDPDSAHEGTIEYTSTDRHIGAKTMRGDLEILGYNLLQWLVGELPWENVLENPKKVHKMKTDFMSSVRTRITTDYPNVPEELIKFFEYIKTLEQKDKPNYTICRQIFESFLRSVGKSRSSKLEFTTTKDNKQPMTTDVLPSSPNGVSVSERAEINNDNKIIIIEELDTPNVKISKKTKPTAHLEDIPPSESDSLIELNVCHEVTPPAVNDFEIEQPDNYQEEEATKAKKKKRVKNLEVMPLGENGAETEQDDDYKEQEVTKSKKNKRNREKKTENEQPAKKRKSSESRTPKKKNKKKLKTVDYPETDSDSEISRNEKRIKAQCYTPEQLGTVALDYVKADNNNTRKSSRNKEKDNRISYRKFL